jgi:protein MpaA
MATERLLTPLDELAEKSRHLHRRDLGTFRSGAQEYGIPAFLHLGPKTDRAPIRLGLFAVLHGDELEGALGLLELVNELQSQPSLATGYTLHLYPVVNPTGLEDFTRLSRNGKDLSREFWIGSGEPEVRLLEHELTRRAFHGIVRLHSQRETASFSGQAGGAPFAGALLAEALRSAAAFLPVRRGEHSVVHSMAGGLRPCTNSGSEPFELALHSPRSASLQLQMAAFSAAMLAILAAFRQQLHQENEL